MAVSGSSQLTPLADLLNSISDDINARIQSGTKTVSVAAGSTNYTSSVTFPVAFASAPFVTVTVTTSQPGSVFAVTNGRTSTGFTCVVRNNVGAFDVTFHWIAVL